jgi:hypothetical protein
VKSDAEFARLRRETGSPILIRIPFGLLGVVMNFRFFLSGWKEPESWFWIVFAAAGALILPALLILTAKLVWRRGLFFGWAHPILLLRWEWWLLIWPTPDEPRWRRRFAVVILTLVTVFAVGGILRWGFFPTF